MGDAVAGLAPVVVVVLLWTWRVRRRSAEPSYDRVADLRRFGLVLLAVGFGGLAVLALVEIAASGR
jgi:hypothetical protein